MLLRQVTPKLCLYCTPPLLFKILLLQMQTNTFNCFYTEDQTEGPDTQMQDLVVESVRPGSSTVHSRYNEMLRTKPMTLF